MTTSTNTKTLLTIKIDKKLKKEAQEMAHEFGVPLGTYVNMKLKEFVRQKEVRVTRGETPNKETIKAILQAEKEFARGEYEGPFTLEELKKEWKLV
ncbi:MAG TPA: type II toxin-antitoxin system RelB/DinJ family antitoxin [Waddliaceae bacterium]